MLLLPARRIVTPRLASKADRPALQPGWDDLPIDRPRPRAGRWRRLLAGRAGNTRLQPGSCCGCTGVSVCGVPQADLTLSFSQPSISAGSYPLIYTPGTPDRWIHDESGGLPFCPASTEVYLWCSGFQPTLDIVGFCNIPLGGTTSPLHLTATTSNSFSNSCPCSFTINDCTFTVTQ